MAVLRWIAARILREAWAAGYARICLDVLREFIATLQLYGLEFPGFRGRSVPRRASASHCVDVSPHESLRESNCATTGFCWYFCWYRSSLGAFLGA